MVIKDKEPLLIQKLRVEVGDEYIFARTFKIPILDNQDEVELILGIVENITENVKQQQELENAEKRWNYALSGSRDAVWDVNLTNDESFFSPVLNEILGYKIYDKLELTWEEMVHPEDLPKAWNAFVDHLEGNTHFYEQEYRMYKSDGSFIWILDRGKIAETDADGNPTRAIGTFSNIDYRKKLEVEYKHALEKAQEASKARSLFLSTMSHEIRTPMNGVIGIINLLLSEQPKPEQMESLNALKYSADNLLFLLNDILDFSKIDAGKMDIETNSINLLELVQNNMKAFIGKANEKGIRLQLKSSNDLPKGILGDQLRINQILNNLISNAVKFTEKGSVIVSLQKQSLNENQVEILFSVTDTGIGIQAHQLAYIFDEFTQASNETTRNYGGTGLGLAITKRLIEIMGGKLEVKSEPGSGSIFWFKLKFDITEAETLPKQEFEPTDYDQLAGMEVLLVEDNAMNVFVARKFLQKWNINTTVASNGIEAVDCAEKASFDLILMDLQMPEMDGFEAAVAIRKFNSQIPIFALTANVNSEAKTRVLECGMTDYISKPFNPIELFTKIAEVRNKQVKSTQKKPISGDLSTLL
jgi:PAS domain S-box-containing protein